MENRDAISGELQKEIARRLEGTPLTVKRLGMADIQFPEVIIRAKELAVEREVEIERVRADLAIAQEQQKIDLTEAETQVKVNQKLAEGVSEAFMKQRALTILSDLANNDSKTIVYLPYEAMSNPSVMIGSSNETFKRQ